jgi:hypothetical protein
LLLALLLAAAWFFREPLLETLVRLGLGTRETPAAPVLSVDQQNPDPEKGYRTLTAALAAAEAGQTVEVGPGVYTGPFELKSGVILVSRTPRAAILRLPQGSAEPAVTAEGVRDARFAGFKIEGTAAAPLEIGLRLADSAVLVEDVEISGAATAGIEISGADRSEIRESYVHDNPGTGVIVRDQAAPRLHGNLILRNGAGPGPSAGPGPGPSAGQLRPGIEIRDTARPKLVQNEIKENAAAGVWVPAADRVDEVFAFNTFGQLAKEKAVRTPPKPGEAPAPAAPARAPQRRRTSRGH